MFVYLELLLLFVCPTRTLTVSDVFSRFVEVRLPSQPLEGVVALRYLSSIATHSSHSQSQSIQNLSLNGYFRDMKPSNDPIQQ